MVWRGGKRFVTSILWLQEDYPDGGEVNLPNTPDNDSTLVELRVMN